MRGIVVPMATSTIPNPFTDLLPAAARRYVYAVAALALLVFSLWQASQGDWAAFVSSLLATLVPLLAASNTTPQKVEQAPINEGDGHGPSLSASEDDETLVGDSNY